MRLFSEGYLADYLRRKVGELRSAAAGESDDYALGVGESQWVEHLVERATVQPIVLLFDDESAERIRMQAPPNPRSRRRSSRGPVEVEGFRFYLPFVGDEQLMRYLPNPGLSWQPDARIVRSELVLEHPAANGDATGARRAWDEFKRNMADQVAKINSNIGAHNSSLGAVALDAVRGRKEGANRSLKMDESLGIPLRRRSSVPTTFSVPGPRRRRKLAPKPRASTGPIRPEPSMDLDVYQAIVRVLHHVGRAMERAPATYIGKGEEGLRDHLLIFLEQNFEGSSTGETFNRVGKTDILCRYEGMNLFVAECKVWTGPKGASAALDQLLGYLTWRESKAALVVFVDRKEISGAIEGANEAVRGHSCFVDVVGSPGEGWDHYRFMLPGDPGRELDLSVLLFHMPGLRTTGR